MGDLAGNSDDDGGVAGTSANWERPKGLGCNWLVTKQNNTDLVPKNEINIHVFTIVIEYTNESLFFAFFIRIPNNLCL